MQSNTCIKQVTALSCNSCWICPAEPLDLVCRARGFCLCLCICPHWDQEELPAAPMLLPLLPALVQHRLGGFDCGGAFPVPTLVSCHCCFSQSLIPQLQLVGSCELHLHYFCFPSLPLLDSVMGATSSHQGQAASSCAMPWPWRAKESGMRRSSSSTNTVRRYLILVQLCTSWKLCPCCHQGMGYWG